MSFVRTAAGLSNQHLFYGVDYVAYTEGGTQTLAFRDLASASFDDVAGDLHYWQRVFASCCPQVKVRFLPAGSKTTLLELARQIEAGNVTHVMVAMDQDHDRLHGNCIRAKGIFYTWGYSWENDVCGPGTLEDVFFNLCPVDRGAHEETIRASIACCYQRFINDIRHLVRADVVLGGNGSGLFPRQSYRKLIKVSASAECPVLDKARMRGRLAQLRRGRKTPAWLPSSDRPVAERDCFGHLVARFFYRLLMQLLSSKGVPCPAEETFHALMVLAFDKRFRCEGLKRVRRHHEGQFAAFLH